MRQSLSFFSSPVFFFLVILFLAKVDADIVNETCQKASQGDKGALQYDFCVAGLRQDPKSHSADLPELGIISANLVKDNATKIGSLIEELLNDRKSDPNLKGCLQDCKLHYSVAERNAKTAIESFESKNYKEANTAVGAALTDAWTCEEAFQESGLKSLLIAEYNSFHQLGLIALDISYMLL
ncbi:putative invertase inhibitor [Macadamia integrifolia]|uniref:putative invertase inhibitor n=1 Tax=Macadamia integrifolia TaxID=60698 RepID=UPI001C4F20F7|nr:putative invertase inhibitor [Macadamia integrifolia]